MKKKAKVGEVLELKRGLSEQQIGTLGEPSLSAISLASLKCADRY